MSENILTLLPKIIAGPIVRRASARQVCFWLITNKAYKFSVKLFSHQQQITWFDAQLDDKQHCQIQVGVHAFVNFFTLEPNIDILCGSRVSYDIILLDNDGSKSYLGKLIPSLLYLGQAYPSFLIRRQIRQMLHGSCRKPHHDSDDGLVIVDQQIKLGLLDQIEPPDLLMMSGDQVYTDDVAGPTLVAIKQTIDSLGLFHEELEGSTISNSKEIFEHTHCFYQRPELLPDDPSTTNTYSQFFAGKRKPIFTSVNASNHLISLAEVMAMYILTWSPEMWRRVNISDEAIPELFKQKFAEEQTIIENFVAGLDKVRRALAHVRVYMIFDDHDITDDWNLTRGWEDAVYGNLFAKRIVGNALVGYWLCQGWGNDPDKLKPLFESCRAFFTEKGVIQHDMLVQNLLDWEHWHYCLETSPKLVVLDTRTQRWRSESSLSKPSGLMDWEALCELQQELIGQEAVIMVSAAPIFGVKLIETIQRIFTFFGGALTVDAENWMAHKGTASVMLNIFRNRKTPPNFVILSGDVHYSFVYDITLRFRHNSPNITQITSSGIKNEFPDKLLKWFDRLNRILYSKYSPLNWFTQRRNMLVRHRKPNAHKLATLSNGSGIGLLKIDQACSKVEAQQLCTSGKVVTFIKKE
ncbi:alkaline phosphatase family protein [uncultured Paraglaciecola sp.]|uniref:alkaline phosphatase family protein n=1 Tax=uncultured Paraglaciecola sp. TaxID=1765024 RepID=UPI0025DDCF44|nr:alkaline phosphatase family protein [uncultured Paraglaciecola sp.]